MRRVPVWLLAALALLPGGALAAGAFVLAELTPLASAGVGAGGALAVFFLTLLVSAPVAAAPADLKDLTERLTRLEALVTDTGRHAIESPAMVWRAAAADIEVLGSLVRDVAVSVGQHDGRLAELETTLRSTAEAQLPSRLAAAQEAVEMAETLAGEQATDADGPLSIVTAIETARAPEPEISATEREMFTPAQRPMVSNEEMARVVADALASERLEVCLQPIVTLPQRKTRGYEVTLRLRDDELSAAPIDIRRLARAVEAERDHDFRLVHRAMQILRVLRSRGRNVDLFCPVAAATAADPDFADLIRSFNLDSGGLAEKLTLAIEQPRLRALDMADAERVALLPQLGTRLALTALEDLRLDPTTLERQGIGVLRVEAMRLISALEGAGIVGDIHMVDFAKLLNRAGIELIADEVDTEQAVVDLLDLEVPFARGALFGQPRPVRPEILQPQEVRPAETVPAAPKPEALPAAPIPLPAAADRVPYRSLLRRANA